MKTLGLVVCVGLGAVACSDDSGVECGPGTVLENGQCVPDSSGPDAGSPAVDAADLPADALRIFVTSTAYERDLGGAAGATALCNAAAAAASLAGSYIPWLSDDDSDALTRIVGEGPWYDTVDRLVFNNRANLSTSPQRAIDRDEQANEIPIASSRRVWTGTAAGGGRDNVCSGNWFGLGTNGFVTVGSTSATGGEWTDSEAIDCIAGGTTAHLYCLQQP